MVWYSSILVNRYCPKTGAFGGQNRKAPESIAHALVVGIAAEDKDVGHTTCEARSEGRGLRSQRCCISRRWFDPPDPFEARSGSAAHLREVADTVSGPSTCAAITAGGWFAAARSYDDSVRDCALGG